MRLAGREEGGEIYLVNMTSTHWTDRSHSVLRECLQAKSESLINPESLASSPTHQHSLTSLLSASLSPESGLITNIVLLGDIQADIHHQESSLSTIKFISGTDPLDWTGFLII